MCVCVYEFDCVRVCPRERENISQQTQGGGGLKESFSAVLGRRMAFNLTFTLSAAVEAGTSMIRWFRFFYEKY